MPFQQHSYFQLRLFSYSCNNIIIIVVVIYCCSCCLSYGSSIRIPKSIDIDIGIGICASSIFFITQFLILLFFF